jgi:hypothetical protein
MKRRAFSDSFVVTTYSKHSRKVYPNLVGEMTLTGTVSQSAT